MSAVISNEPNRQKYLNRMISARVPDELMSKLDEIAVDGGITRCDLIRRMLWYYVHALEAEENMR